MANEDVPKIEVTELRSFAAKADATLGVAEVHELIDYIAANPDAGDVIPGTGGIRKLRWAASGRGTRGGARIIYYYHDDAMPVFLLALYTKGEKIDLTASEKKAMRALVGEIIAGRKAETARHGSDSECLARGSSKGSRKR